MSDSSPLSESALRRAVFSSRRGMLELDLLLVPYAKEKLPAIAPQEQEAFVDFLSEEDADLFTWLMQSVTPRLEKFVPVVEAILAHNDSKGPVGS